MVNPLASEARDTESDSQVPDEDQGVRSYHPMLDGAPGAEHRTTAAMWPSGLRRMLWEHEYAGSNPVIATAGDASSILVPSTHGRLA